MFIELFVSLRSSLKTNVSLTLTSLIFLKEVSAIRLECLDFDTPLSFKLAFYIGSEVFVSSKIEVLLVLLLLYFLERLDLELVFELFSRSIS